MGVEVEVVDVAGIGDTEGFSIIAGGGAVGVGSTTDAFVGGGGGADVTVDFCCIST